jgi:hypothetical protein
MIKLMLFVGLALLVFALFVLVPLMSFLYRRKLRREGRTIGVDEVRSALQRGGHRLVRLGEGRNSDIWLLDTPGQEHEDVEMAAMDAAIDARSDGRLVTPCDSRQARDLIILAESLNSFVDVPIEPDVDPSPR